LDWTLFDGFEKKNKLKVNALNSEKLKIQQDNLQQQLELATTIAKQQIDIQSNSLLIAKEQLMLAERVYKQTEAQFNQGLISSNDLILAENSQREAQTKLVVAYVQLRNAEINYLKSIGNIN
jgi:outer membrane protein TolC